GLPEGVSLRLARGIRVEAACLMCHGDNIAPPIAERLAALYPEDGATGFLEGDLRGLVWVEVPTATEPLP
ncbi:c-type heme family protein, partial [Arenimonas caeni]